MLTIQARSLFRRMLAWIRGRNAAPGFDIRSPGDRTRLLAKFDLPVSAELPRAVRHPDTAARVREIYQLRADVRDVFPLGLTPAQLHDYGEWLLRHGRAEYGFHADEVIGFIYEQADDPSKGLIETYLLTPEWQSAVPDAFTDHGWRKLRRWLAKRYRDHAGRWLREAECHPCPLPSAGGEAMVNLLGHFKYESGLQEEVLRQAEVLAEQGYKICLRDLPVSFPRVIERDRRFLDPELGDITIIKLGAQLPLDQAYRRAGWHPRLGVYRIVCWSWEVEEFPQAAFEGAAGLADEAWAVSEYCADAIRKVMPGIPVHTMPVVIPSTPFEMRPRSAFGLPEGFLFLFAFDMASGMERKNPLGLIRAFRQAFSPAEPVRLALKVSRGREHPEDFARLTREADAAGIVIIDQVISRADVRALLAACDSYVSLHRSEGFGMTMAEAMLLGKPTIATGYSGNLDFMTAENSYLVNARRVTLDREYPPYGKGCTWSEPSVDHAAQLMRRVYERRDEAAAVAARGRISVETSLSPIAGARRMLSRIAEIRSHLVRRPMD